MMNLARIEADWAAMRRFRSDVLAFDFESVREKNQDGHLIVRITNISKANVCPYVGKEIPGFEELGLDPDKIYKLYRDAAELEKAAETFNNLALLNQHIPVYAQDYAEQARQHTIGCTGGDGTFEEPYLKNKLVIWDGDAITRIESGEQKELSCGYHYTPDMTSGTSPEGEPYDGIMRDIVGNHVALVKEGRAGPDVVVGDSKGATMSKKITRQGAIAMCVLASYLRPRLAQDQSVNLVPIVGHLTAKQFDAQKPDVLEKLRRACRGKLAVDSPLGEVAEILDMVSAHPEGVETDADLPEGLEEPIQDIGENFAEPDVMDADPASELEAFLKDKLSPEDLKVVMEMIGGGGGGHEEGHDAGAGEEELEELGAAHDRGGRRRRGARDDDLEENAEDPAYLDEDEGETEQQFEDDQHEWRRQGNATDRRRGHARDRRRGTGRDDPPAFSGKPTDGVRMTGDSRNYVSKRQMDATIETAVAAARRTERDIRNAERVVQPYVGQMNMTFDSAADVYRRALKIMGVRGVEQVHPSALRTILELQPKPGQRRAAASSSTSRVTAGDSKNAAGSFHDVFPDAMRIGLN